MTNVAFLFPGQGSQFVGMGAELLRRDPIVAETLSEIEDITGIALRRVMLAGPRRELKETHIAQPAIFALGMGAFRRLQSEGTIAPTAMCGHSLGQFTALTAAGAFTLADGARLAAMRGRWMHERNLRHDGAMIAVSRLDLKAIETIVADAPKVWTANVNAPRQTVLSGEAADLKPLAARLEACGGSVARLDVAGAYHSPLMRPAAEALTAALSEIRIHDPVCPVIANTDAARLTSAAAVRAELERHMLAPVLWQAGMETLSDMGVQAAVELGAGRAMKGLWLRNLPDAACWTTNDGHDLRRLFAAFGGASQTQGRLS